MRRVSKKARFRQKMAEYLPTKPLNLAGEQGTTSEMKRLLLV